MSRSHQRIHDLLVDRAPLGRVDAQQRPPPPGAVALLRELANPIAAVAATVNSVNESSTERNSRGIALPPAQPALGSTG